MDVVWLIALLVIILATAGTAAWAGLRAAPFLPTRQKDVERMFALAGLQPGEIVYDLGAGDGRFVVTAVTKYGATATGYEISLLPYLVAKLRLLISGVGSKGQLRFQDFFHVDLSQANVVVCFLTPGAMAKLAPKFKRELKPGTRIVSYAFSLPGWTPERKDKPTERTMPAYLYRIS